MMRRLIGFLCAVVVFCFGSSAFAAAAFTGPTTYTGANGASTLATGDFNTDSNIDVVIADSGNGKLAIFLGNALGTFELQTTMTLASVVGVEVADVNGDQKPDILAISSGVHVYLGDGAGNFTATSSTYGTGASYDLAIGDVNGDGHVDFAFSATGGTYVYLGDGTGAFSAARSPYTSGYAYNTKFADVNNDGKLDIVVPTNNGPLVVLLGDGSGNFAAATHSPFSTGLGAQGAGACAVGDINGDQNIDVVIGGYGTSSVILMLGAGDGSFSASSTSPLTGVGVDSTAPILVDFNGDGKLDLATTSYSDSVHGLYFFIGDGSAGFTAAPGSPLSSQLWWLTSTDVNHDGAIDLLATSKANSQLQVFLNTANITTTTVSSSANPSGVNQAVTFTATVAPTNSSLGTPTGSVTFYDGTNSLGTITLVAGKATVTTSTLTFATHPIKATYSGDTTFNLSNGTLAQIVGPDADTTTLTSDTNPSVYGQSVTITAHVAETSYDAGGSAVPTGTITFFDGTTNLGNGSLDTNGNASITVSTLAVGTNAITATYSGDALDRDGGTTMALSQVVNPSATTTTLISSSNPSAFGASVTFTATVAATSPGKGTPTGTISFKDGSTEVAIATIDANGSATLIAGSTSSSDGGAVDAGASSATIAALSGGTHTITATYLGDTNFAASTSTDLAQDVATTGVTLALVSSLNPSTYAKNVTFTATVASANTVTATGMVSFADGMTTLGTSVIDGNGVATYATSTLAGGSHTITATYEGDSNYSAGANGSLMQVVNPAATTTALTASPMSASTGSQIALSARVTSSIDGAITGSVTFDDGALMIGSATLDANGNASITIATLAAGAHAITAIYGGATNFATSTSAPVTVTITAPVAMVDAGTSDASTNTGARDAGMDATVDTDAEGAPNGTVVSKSSSGCGCRTSSAPTSPFGMIGALGAIASFVARRRRR